MATNCNLGYLMESGYAEEGGAIRHGETLRDMLVDFSENIRVLGMIGLCDTQAEQSAVLSGSSPLAYMVLVQDGSIALSKVRYTDPAVKVYGLDPDLTGVKQAIRLEMFGYTALSVVTLSGGVS